MVLQHGVFYVQSLTLPTSLLPPENPPPVPVTPPVPPMIPPPPDLPVGVCLVQEWRFKWLFLGILHFHIRCLSEHCNKIKPCLQSIHNSYTTVAMIYRITTPRPEGVVINDKSCVYKCYISYLIG